MQRINQKAKGPYTNAQKMERKMEWKINEMLKVKISRITGL